ncbi:hypothetical protein K1T71_010656 [Dendrolimus kikuchii]|uniref:Uncharacterized protein n=1 Tax=Dendrolimus kikuchii TaxID=765133 RepID=A0ACC1CPM3_9NEOP|nr:hypothetical protein K1T71_010656 [Dendrolimus kikuchii]
MRYRYALSRESYYYTMKMFMFWFFTVFSAASAFVILDGTCPDNVKPLENFDLTAFSGNWYDYANYPPTAAGVGKCGIISYTKEGDVVKVRNANVVNGVEKYVEGVAKFTGSEKVADYVVGFKFGDKLRENALEVIATDYTNYAVFYKCDNEPGNKSRRESLWVASRAKTLEGEPMKEVTDFLKSKGFDTSKLVDGDFSEEACKFTSTSRIDVFPY